MDTIWARQMTEQDQIVRLATRELLQLISANSTATTDQILMVYQAVIEKYGQLAAGSAFQAIENSRRAAGKWRELPIPEIAEPAANEHVAKTFSWALSTAWTGDVQDLAAKLASPLGRLVQQRARHTIWNAAASSGGKSRFARLPEPTACHFCLMLASRGAVYVKETVTATTRAAHRPDGVKFHDHCRCVAIESYTRADLPGVIQDLEDEWREVTWGADGMPLPDQAEVWKQHIQATRK